MSELWELFQEYQISKRKRQSTDAEGTLAALEDELDLVEELLAQVIPIVENLSGEQIQADV